MLPSESRHTSGSDLNEHIDQAGEAIPWFEWHKYLMYCGPGVLMCIAYLDPGNLEADLQQGSYTNFSLVWVMVLAHCGGFLLQILAAKLGNVTGSSLAQTCRKEMSIPVSFLLYIMTELAIIGSDIQEVLGSAMAFQILLGIPMWLGCLLTGFDSLIFLSIEHYGAGKLEALVVVMVGIMSISFGMNFVQAMPSARTFTSGFLPCFQDHAVRPAVGTIGSIIMPHNIHLHSALVLSCKINRTSHRQVKEANKYCAIDAAFALCICFCINLSVVGCFAKHFYHPVCASASFASACLAPELQAASFGTFGSCNFNGVEGVCTEIGLRSAGDAMRASLGDSARYIWAVGLLAAGMSSTMMSTYAGQFVMEGFLDLKMSRCVRMVITRCISLVPALIVAQVSVTWGPLADMIGQWLNVLQSMQLPFALVPMLLFTDSMRIMGRFHNHWMVSIVSWSLAGLVLAANAFLVTRFLSDFSNHFSHSLALYIILVPLSGLYVSALSWVIFSSRGLEEKRAKICEKDPTLNAEQMVISYGSNSGDNLCNVNC